VGPFGQPQNLLCFDIVFFSKPHFSLVHCDWDTRFGVEIEWISTKRDAPCLAYIIPGVLHHKEDVLTNLEFMLNDHYKVKFKTLSPTYVLVVTKLKQPAGRLYFKYEEVDYFPLGKATWNLYCFEMLCPFWERLLLQWEGKWLDPLTFPPFVQRLVDWCRHPVKGKIPRDYLEHIPTDGGRTKAVNLCQSMLPHIVNMLSLYRYFTPPLLN